MVHRDNKLGVHILHRLEHLVHIQRATAPRGYQQDVHRGKLVYLVGRQWSRQVSQVANIDPVKLDRKSNAAVIPRRLGEQRSHYTTHGNAMKFILSRSIKYPRVSLNFLPVAVIGVMIAHRHHHCGAGVGPQADGSGVGIGDNNHVIGPESETRMPQPGYIHSSLPSLRDSNSRFSAGIFARRACR